MKRPGQPLFWERLTPRERLLSALVAGVVFLLFNVVVIGVGARKATQWRAAAATKGAEVRGLETLYAERAMWEGRAAWLRERQPALANEGSAGVELLDEIKKVAQQHGVTILNPAIGTPQGGRAYRAVKVNIETKSSWEGLLHFLHTLQQPTNFIVFEAVNLQIAADDPAKLHGRFRVARWGAP